MTAYYNEFDPKAAAWLRELIAGGLIAHGEVDERSIVDVTVSDLKGYSQHHFFAGIGGWSYALRLAGWPDDLPVWTASLPCQPFSAAGKGLGKQDERHLLPHFISLVAQCRPAVLFGEQVSAAIKHGWLDDLQANMEAEGYAVGHVVLGAHSIGAPHIRQRLYWVADNGSARYQKQSSDESRKNFAGGCGMVYSDEPRSQQGIETAEAARYGGAFESTGCVIEMGNTKHEQHERKLPRYREEFGQNGEREASEFTGLGKVDWIYCRDNKYRPIESGTLPLVDGVPRGMVHSSDPRNTQEARKVRLKGYGNAIVPTLAAEFIRAYMESVL